MIDNDENNVKDVILNIIKVYGKIWTNCRCEEKDAIYLESELKNLGEDLYSLDEKLTVEERAKQVVEDAGLIFKNIDTLWPIEPRHYHYDVGEN
jgi:hypothetical protein